MTPTQIDAGLAERAEEFTRALFADRTIEEDGACLTLTMQTGERIAVDIGFKAGTWTMNGEEGHGLSLLWATARGVIHKHALEECAQWLGAELDRPEPEPVRETIVKRADSHGQQASQRPVDESTRPKVTYLPDIHRLLPQSAEAEKGLICSFLLAPFETGNLCKEKGITPAHFHLPANAVLYEQLQWLHTERMPIDFITLTQMLRDQGLLDQVGGAAHVTELFTYLPTAANAGYYIDTLLEKFTLREVIRKGTEYVARAYDEQHDVASLVDDFAAKVKSIAEERATAGFREILAKRRFDPQHPPPEPVPVWKLGEAIIATPGNLMAVQAKAKAGKTALIGAMIACTLSPDERGDTFGITAANHKGQALLHFDTEQSPWDHHQGLMRALKRATRSAAPPWLCSYCITDLPLRVRLEILRQELHRASQTFGGVLGVILDGIADYLKDPNDPEESFSLIDELHQLAIRFNTVVVCVLHENPGAEAGKTRGHLGSQLERKAETNLRLEKDAEGITVIFSERARNTHIPKDKGQCFAWNDEHKMHLTVPSGSQLKPAFAHKFTKEEVLNELSAIDGVRPKEFVARLREFKGMSKATVYRFIAQLNHAGLVCEKDGQWFRKPPAKA